MRAEGPSTRVMRAVQRLGFLSTLYVLSLLSLWPLTASSQTKVPVYYMAGEIPSPLLDGAVMLVEWPNVQPSPDTFDWSDLDARLATRAAIGGNPVLLKTIPYGQTPIDGDATGDNTHTPEWIYDVGVPRITFVGGGMAAGSQVTVPKVWDADFYPYYLAFLRQFALRYGSDDRVAGFVIGIGHIGNLTAQPSAGGGAAFQAAGWTLAGWERYAKRVIRTGAQQFTTKPVYIVFTSQFLQGVDVIDNLATAKRIAAYAASRGVSIVFSGLDADPAKFAGTGISEIAGHLGTLTLPPGFSMGFTDDFPLWSENGDDGRDVNGLRIELQQAVDVWASIGGKYPMFYVFHEPEASASFTGSVDFDPAVYGVVVDFVYP